MKSLRLCDFIQDFKTISNNDESINPSLVESLERIKQFADAGPSGVAGNICPILQELLQEEKKLSRKHRLLLKATIMNALSWLSTDRSNCQDEKLTQFVPFVAEFFQSLHKYKNTESYKEVLSDWLWFVEGLGANPEGLQVMIKHKVITSLCRHAASNEILSSIAELFLLNIVGFKGSAAWESGNTEGFIHLMENYTNQLPKLEPEVLWLKLDRIAILLDTANRSALYELDTKVWCSNLHKTVVSLVCKKQTRQVREQLIDVVAIILNKFDEWDFKTDKASLPTFTNLLCFEISTAFGHGSWLEVIYKDEHFINVISILTHLYEEIILDKEITKKICRPFTGAMNAFCTFLKNYHETKLFVELASTNTEIHIDEEKEKHGSLKYVFPQLFAHIIQCLGNAVVLHNIYTPGQEYTAALPAFMDMAEIGLRKYYIVDMQCHEIHIDMLYNLSRLLLCYDYEVDRGSHKRHRDFIKKWHTDFLLVTWGSFMQTERYLAQNPHGKAQLDLTEMLGNMARITNVLISEIPINSRLVTCENDTTLDAFKRLMNFAITNLPYLETKDDFVNFAFAVMTLGLYLSCHLPDEALGTDLPEPFTEACVNLLRKVHQVQVLKKEKQGSIITNPMFQSCGLSYWTKTMAALHESILRFPSITSIILETDWIEEIVDMLETVRVNNQTKGTVHPYCQILAACALKNDDCKQIILQRNGKQLATKFQMDFLAKALKS